MKKTKKRVSKPKLMRLETSPIYSLGYNDYGIKPWVVFRSEQFEDEFNYFEAREMRKIAAWLTQAADYLEQKEAKR